MQFVTILKDSFEELQMQLRKRVVAMERQVKLFRKQLTTEQFKCEKNVKNLEYISARENAITCIQLEHKISIYSDICLRVYRVIEFITDLQDMSHKKEAEVKLLIVNIKNALSSMNLDLLPVHLNTFETTLKRKDHDFSNSNISYLPMHKLVTKDEVELYIAYLIPEPEQNNSKYKWLRGLF